MQARFLQEQASLIANLQARVGELKLERDAAVAVYYAKEEMCFGLLEERDEYLARLLAQEEHSLGLLHEALSFGHVSPAFLAWYAGQRRSSSYM